MGPGAGEEAANGGPGSGALFLYTEALEAFSYPEGNPFQTGRARLARQTLLSMGVLGPEEARFGPASRAELERFHLPRYLDTLEAAEAGEALGPEILEMGLGTPDCPLFPGVFAYGALAAGGSLAGARLLLEGRAAAVFNPSGGFHHAHPGRAGGFCYINDVVLACELLAAAGRRVLFLDIDAHHCDGVQDAFYGRSDVLVLSFHESGRTLFPGTGFEGEIGSGEGEGFTANVPMPAGTYDEAFLDAFRRVALPLMGAYAPDVIVLEAGMDALAGDPLTHLELTNNAHAEVLEAVRAQGKPLLLTGGGGYHPRNTARGWALLWAVLTGHEAGGDDLNLGLGGVMLESTEWGGGLRDRRRFPGADQRAAVEPVLDETVRRVREALFPRHGLEP